jgi:(R,R)-butanediol dehydrogenase / meso-butanediol dehydrogenase / diacetyl reductase
MVATRSTAIVVRAQRDPQAGTTPTAPQRTYRWPRVAIEACEMGPLAPDHVRVGMRLVGLCGTDLHAVRAQPGTGYITGSAPLDIGGSGRVLGHEGVGEVLEVGASLQTPAVGTLVTFESILTCGECALCRGGQRNHCRGAKLLGLEFDGLFRTMVDVPARLAHDVSDRAGSRDGALGAACVEPAACAYNAVQAAEVEAQDRVVIFGAGPVGFLAAMICRRIIGAAVRVVEPIPFRRERARAFADECEDVDEFFARAGEQETDVVIEASGDLRNVDRLFERLAPRARVVLLARSGQPLELRDVDHLITNGVTIRGSRGYSAEAFAEVLRLWRAGRLPLHEAVTGVVAGLPDLLREIEGEPMEQRHVKLLARL